MLSLISIADLLSDTVYLDCRDFNHFVFMCLFNYNLQVYIKMNFTEYVPMKDPMSTYEVKRKGNVYKTIMSNMYVCVSRQLTRINSEIQTYRMEHY